MSGLMNLFSGGMNADSNDSLKYSAPKEPKKKKKDSPQTLSTDVKATESTLAPAASANAPLTQAAPKTIGPSKMLANSPVHLYKLNPATRAYDAIEGGGLLGCVLMGSGLNFQLLIYNAQKQPQALINLTPSFDYTVAGLYLSFQDASGNYYSLLFDVIDAMYSLLRYLTAVIIHLQSYNGDSGEMPNIKRALPAAVDQTPEDTTTLNIGMMAGIYYSIWEIGELADYPTEVVATAPLFQNKEPDDLLKVKLSETEEYLPGLSQALIGCKRGDRFILGIPPQSLSKPILKGLFDLSKKKNEMAYLYVLIEISKIKSEGKEKNSNRNRESSITEEREESTIVNGQPVTDISQRMAKMSAAGGGGGALALAGIMNPKAKSHPESPSVSEGKKTVQFRENLEDVSPIPMVPVPAKEISKPSKPILHQQVENVVPFGQSATITTATSGTTATAATTTTQTSAIIASNTNTTGTNIIGNTNTGINFIGNTNTGTNIIGNTNTSTTTMMLATSDSSSSAAAAAAIVASPQIQQSLMIVQQSMMQLHTKLDQVGMQVNTVYGLQQQQQSQQQQISMTLQTLSNATTAAASSASTGSSSANPMLMGAGMNAMAMMPPPPHHHMMAAAGGYNPMMFNPYYGMYGAMPPMPPPSSSAPTLPTSSNPLIQQKSQAMIQDLSFLLQQYEQLAKENQELKTQLAASASPSPTPPSQQQQQQQQEKEKIQQLQQQLQNLETEKKAVEQQRQQQELQKNQEIEQLRQELSRSQQQLQSVETYALFQSKLEQAVTNATSSLQQQFQQLQEQYIELQDQQHQQIKKKTSSETGGETSTSDNALRQQISELEQLLRKKEEEIQTLQQQQQQPTHSNNNSNSSNNGEAEETPVGAAAAKKYTEEDLKRLVSEIFQLAMNGFMTEEELHRIEEEDLRNHTLQVVKTTLKRLKEILRQATAEYLQ